MQDKDLIRLIEHTFRDVQRPPFDQSLVEDDRHPEAWDIAEAFKPLTDWSGIDVQFLNQYSSALSFFTEMAFRFYMPAFLVADVKSGLNYDADPGFHLTYGLYKPGRDDAPEKSSGRTDYVNPIGYGAITCFDRARFRLSVFTREESETILAYLGFKQKQAEMPQIKDQIEQAISNFWLERSKSAPTAVDFAAAFAAKKKAVDDARKR